MNSLKVYKFVIVTSCAAVPVQDNQVRAIAVWLEKDMFENAGFNPFFILFPKIGGNGI